MTQPITADGFPSEAEIKAIGQMTDATARNTWITWSYYRLDRAMAAVNGEADLSWCAFATWASNTAGGFISESVFPRLLVDWINHTHDQAGPLERVALAILDVVGFPVHALAAEILDSVSGAIGGGNQAVFLDVAPPYARLLTMLDGRSRLDPAEREAFLRSLPCGQDPNVETAIRNAFVAILDASELTDPRLRAERILVANTWVGWAEQTLVQRYIIDSMDAPTADVLRALLFRHIKDSHPIATRFMPDKVLSNLLKPLAQLLELTFRDIETVYMMRLNTPDQILLLGHDVPPLADGRAFPADLTDITSPDLAELLMLLHAQKLEGTAATDWSSFDQRMTYIGTLFRSRQQHLVLRTTQPAAPTVPLPLTTATPVAPVATATAAPSP